MTALRSRLKSWLGKPGQAGRAIAAPAVPKSIVVCTPQVDKGRSHTLAEQLVIGRSFECDVVLDDGYCSQQHARLFVRGGQQLLEDLDSNNGTYVNRQLIQTVVVVHPGDQIQIGTTVFEVKP